MPVDCVDMEVSLTVVDEMVSGDQPRTIIAVNPEKVIKAQGNPDILESLHQGGLLIPDGIGIVFASRLLGLGRMSRVPGSELMPAICEYAEKKEYKVFLYGASEEVNAAAAYEIRRRFPTIQIAGRQHGYLQEAAMPDLIANINSSGAQILFIALGSPRQELWMKRYLPQLNIKVCQGVGGTFDVLAGKVKRAPPFFRAIHLEWLYRLLAQPGRLLRQTALPLFAFQVIRKKIIS